MLMGEKWILRVNIEFFFGAEGSEIKYKSAKIIFRFWGFLTAWQNKPAK